MYSLIDQFALGFFGFNDRIYVTLNFRAGKKPMDGNAGSLAAVADELDRIDVLIARLIQKRKELRRAAFEARSRSRSRSRSPPRSVAEAAEAAAASAQPDGASSSAAAAPAATVVKFEVGKTYRARDTYKHPDPYTVTARDDNGAGAPSITVATNGVVMYHRTPAIVKSDAFKNDQLSETIRIGFNNSIYATDVITAVPRPNSASSSASSGSLSGGSSSAAAASGSSSSAQAAAAPKDYLVWRLKTPTLSSYVYDSTVKSKDGRDRAKRLYVGALVSWKSNLGHWWNGTVLTLKTKGSRSKRYPAAVVIPSFAVRGEKNKFLEIAVYVWNNIGVERFASGEIRLREESVFKVGDTVRVRKLQEFEPLDTMQAIMSGNRRSGSKPSTFVSATSWGRNWYLSLGYNYDGTEQGTVVKVDASGSTEWSGTAKQKPRPFITVRFPDGEEKLFTEYQLAKSRLGSAPAASSGLVATGQGSATNLGASTGDKRMQSKQVINLRF